jgi:hypothetical protein
MPPSLVLYLVHEGYRTMSKRSSPSTFRKAAAAILDFFTVFAIGGYALAKATGNVTDGGFSLNGAPALLLFGLIAAYFYVGYTYAGGTLWQRILGVR